MNLRDWLEAKPFTLTMSSGFFGFFAHAGMLSALLSQGLKPTKITGSSAGALIGATWASGIDAEPLKQVLFSLQKSDFWDPSPGLGLLKGRKFRSKLSTLLGCENFEQCRVPVALSAWDGLTQTTRVLEQGSLIDAIYASCAVPFLFHPIWIGRRPLWDGGINDRPGLKGTSEGERVFYHHIASRSPWRRKGSKALALPEQENMISLVIYGIPRSGPEKLSLGPEIFDKAFKATEQALNCIIENGRGVFITVDG